MTKYIRKLKSTERVVQDMSMCMNEFEITFEESNGIQMLLRVHIDKSKELGFKAGDIVSIENDDIQKVEQPEVIEAFEISKIEEIEDGKVLHFKDFWGHFFIHDHMPVTYSFDVGSYICVCENHTVYFITPKELEQRYEKIAP